MNLHKYVSGKLEQGGQQYTNDAFFEVNIRICQPKNSDVHRGKAKVNITFECRLILMLTKTECTNCFVLWNCLSFPFFTSSLFHIYKYTQVRCPWCTENKIISTVAFQVSETFMRCAKELHFLNKYFHKMIKFFTCEIIIRNHASFFYPSFEWKIHF